MVKITTTTKKTVKTKCWSGYEETITHTAGEFVKV